MKIIYSKFWNENYKVKIISYGSVIWAGPVLWSRNDCANYLRDGRSLIVNRIFVTEAGYCKGGGKKIRQAYQISC